MRSADFSIFADRPVRLRAGCYASLGTLQVTEQREHDRSEAVMASVYGAVPAGGLDRLRRAVDAFNRVMAEADAPPATNVVPLSPAAAALLGGTPVAAE